MPRSETLEALSHFGAVAGRYDAILCDVWGVIHNGRKAFTRACDTLCRFREGGGRVVLLTNAPVPKDRVIAYFEPLGVPGEAYDDCVSSGDATRDLLAKNTDKALWIFGMDEGWDHDKYLYEGLGLERVSDYENAEIGLLMGLRDMDHHPEDYRVELRQIAARGLHMVCANPDRQVRIGDKLYWCAGALAEIYTEEGGVVTYPGKPHAAIYQAAYDRLAKLGVAHEKSRILAIGDGPATDMRGAEREGIDGLYVGTGLASHSYSDGDFLDEVRLLLKQHGTRATYAMAELAW